MWRSLCVLSSSCGSRFPPLAHACTNPHMSWLLSECLRGQCRIFSGAVRGVSKFIPNFSGANCTERRILGIEHRNVSGVPIFITLHVHSSAFPLVCHLRRGGNCTLCFLQGAMGWWRSPSCVLYVVYSIQPSRTFSLQVSCTRVETQNRLETGVGLESCTRKGDQTFHMKFVGLDCFLGVSERGYSLHTQEASWGNLG